MLCPKMANEMPNHQNPGWAGMMEEPEVSRMDVQRGTWVANLIERMIGLRKVRAIAMVKSCLSSPCL